MPASITIATLSWATPDGRPLFSDLDLSFGAERVGLVGRNGVGKTTLLKIVSGELLARSGSVAVSGKVGVLRQAVHVRAGETIADLFGVRAALDLLARAAAGAASAEDLAQADWTLDARMAAALSRVGLEADQDTQIAALSGGQRTRAALAALVFAEPDFLLLDEPTNNLDRDGRDAVLDLLANWCAGAIAREYEALGGRVVMAGKPHAPIYELAYRELEALTGRAIGKSRILAIGDGIGTDIAGADAQGIDSLFVASGMHGEALWSDGVLDTAKLDEAFAAEKHRATYVARVLE